MRAFFFINLLIQALAAANPRHSPPYVKEKKTLLNNFIYFFFPTTADKGTPLEIALAKQEISGVTPYNFWAPPKEYLNPVTTSSKISKLLFFIHTFRYEHISHNYYGFGQDIIIRFDRLFPNKEPCIIQDANSILLYNEGYNLYLLYCD